MVKFLLGILTGIVLTVFFFAALALMAWAVGEAEPSIAEGSVLVMELSGPLPEHVATDFALDLFQRRAPATLLDVRNAFLKAAADDRIRAVALTFGNLQAGWAQAQELRTAIENFRRSGKPVLAYLERSGALEYYIASAADGVYLAPEGLLNVKGLRAEVSFYKDTLEKLGAEAQMEHVGKYKSAVEPYTRSEMSDAFREVTNALLDGLLEQFLTTLAASREMTPEQVRSLLDQGPFLPRQAHEAGLVDELLYEDEFEQRLGERIGEDDWKEVKLSRYRKVSLASLGLSGTDTIAVVYAVGAIVAGKSEVEPFFGVNVLGSDSFIETLRSVKKNDEVKAVVLRIDSPGGDALASDLMWRELNLLKNEKPVVVSMSDVAASGGYYIAAIAGAPIVAYPGTLTGSIGVLFGKLNLRGFYDKIGVHKEILTRGRFADIDTDYRGFAPEEREKVREGVEAVYDSFVEKVAQARSSTWEEIHEVAQGRVWLGSQAIHNGLVDELGGFDEAIAVAKREAGIAEEAKVRLITYPVPKNVFQVLLEDNGLARAAAAVDAATVLPQRLRQELRDLPLWPALLDGGLMRAMPYTITIQ